MDLIKAYAHCEQIAKLHYENFPVASYLLPAKLRPHVAAIYAFARTADDFADEPGYHAGERMRLLRDWRARLHAPGAAGRAPGTPDPRSRIPDPDNVFLALHDTIDRFALPMQLFDDLLNAFVQDVGTTRYSTWADVLDYCRRSANPVGRLVLRLSGYHDDRLDAASDAVCTALQLTNFWQDFAVDWSRGRLYVPEEIWRVHDADVAALDARLMTSQWRAALADCGARTRALFEQGRPVCDGVSGRLRYELRATWLGGTRILDRLERAGYDVFNSDRPKLGASDALVIACGTLLWRETRPSPIRS
ncbi:MAG TPA: squalene synthase HpnC [Vicinamibacterales bacterium]|nr:squalene synthase HpnC [Vicinamibacterales bacterium]